MTIDSTPAQPSSILQATAELETWLIRNGLTGWDPYDVMGHTLFKSIAGVSQSGLRPKSLVARVAHGGLRRAPVTTRRLLGVRPEVNAKGVGLLLSAWLQLDSAGDERAAAQIPECATWLLDNPNSGPWQGVYWGYPFDWNSRVFIPRGTPSAVVTSTCAQALLDYALSPADKPFVDAAARQRALDVAHGAATFLATGLNRFEAAPGQTVLSYTPLDDFRVHNASLMAGELLLRCADVFGEESWRELAVALLRYTLADQSKDGSFEYWGPGQRDRSHIDNYHTGFVLRSLYAYELAGIDGVSDALDRGWEYYVRHLFGDDGRPLDKPGSLLPLNIHSCAESVLCPATLSSRFDAALELARSSAEWSVANMTNPDGSFAYLWRANGTLDRTPHLRWGQAWMLRALAELAAAHATR